MMSQPLPDPFYDVGVVFALAIEAGGLVDRLTSAQVMKGDGFTARVGTCGGRRLALVESGVGRAKAVKATHALLDAYRPRWVLSAGFSGGLDPSLARNDLIVADALIETNGQEGKRGQSPFVQSRAPTEGWSRAVPTNGDCPRFPHIEQFLAALSSGMPAWKFHVGRLLTTEGLVRLPEEKQALGTQFAALAVDMESGGVAEVCRQRGVPFAAVRIVSDTVQDVLPPDIERLLTQQSTAGRLGAALGTLWRRPSSAKDMLRLQQIAILASDRLAEFLAQAIPHLPCPPNEPPRLRSGGSGE